jgi:dTDP-4-dehydrorhamnose reductase
MKILVTGANGQLGKSIQKAVANDELSNEFVFVGRSELDLSQNDNFEKYFKKNSFDVVVNCAAYTAVDKAESEIELANQINHLAVRKLAEIAQKKNIKLIYISTDYVFDGEVSHSYTETDTTNPINIYGQTKLAGEKAIQAIMPTNATIIRTSWVYSEYGNNFVSTMLKLSKERDELSVVNDQIGSPTYATDLANVILKIITNKDYQNKDRTTEIYHYSNKGKISWHEFATEIFELADIHCAVQPITTKQYPTPAKRPKNTLMNKAKIAETFGVDIPNWEESLNTCIAILKEQQ